MAYFAWGPETKSRAVRQPTYRAGPRHRVKTLKSKVHTHTQTSRKRTRTQNSQVYFLYIPTHTDLSTHSHTTPHIYDAPQEWDA